MQKQYTFRQKETVGSRRNYTGKEKGCAAQPHSSGNIDYPYCKLLAEARQGSDAVFPSVSPLMLLYPAPLHYDVIVPEKSSFRIKQGSRRYIARCHTLLIARS